MFSIWVYKDNHILFNLVLLAIYVLAVLGITLLMREPSGKVFIQTEWLRGNGVSNPNLVYKDNLFNFLLFIPVGFLVGLLSRRFKILSSFLFGLFVSETIECSQLIWQLGSFDVDDLFFNTLGALFGGLLVVMVVWLKRPKKKSNPSG